MYHINQKNKQINCQKFLWMRKNKKRNFSKTLKKYKSQEYLQSQPYHTPRPENIYQWGDHFQKTENDEEKLYTEMLQEFNDNIRVCYQSLAGKRKHPTIKRCLLMELMGIQNKQKYFQRAKLNPEKMEKFRAQGEKSSPKEKIQPHKMDKNRKNKKVSLSKENKQKCQFDTKSKKKNDSTPMTRQLSAVKAPLILSRCNSVNQISFHPFKTSKEYNNSQKESRVKKVQTPKQKI